MERYLAAVDNVIGLGNIGDQASIASKLCRLDYAQIRELQSALTDALPSSEARDERYRFLANSQSSGLPYPCASFECRGRELRTMTYFSAAYANEVLFFNPFPTIHSSPNWKIDFANEMAFHISEILMMRPLIERNLVSFIDFRQYAYCENCFRKGLAAATGLDQEADIYFIIARDIIEKTEVVYDFHSDDRYHFSINTTSEFYGHDKGGYVIRRAPKALADIKQGAKLTKSEIETLGICVQNASFASNDIVQVNDYAQSLNVDNIFSSKSQLSVLRQYFGNEKIGSNIDVNYPFIAQGNLDDVIKFREDEWHHLHDFREFMESCIKEGKRPEQEIEHEFARIEHIVRRADRSINRRILKGSGVLATNLFAAVATAGVSSLISGVIGALGGGHFATKLLPDIVDKFSEPEEIRDSKIYYAWKAVKQDSH